MKDYNAFIQFGVSFEERDQVFALLEAFRNFLDKEVPVDNFVFQDIRLSYHEFEKGCDLYGKNH